MDSSAEASPWESGGNKDAGDCEAKGGSDQVQPGDGWNKEETRICEIDQQHVASPPREQCTSSGARPFVGRSPEHGDGTSTSAQSEVELGTAVGLDSGGDSSKLANGRHTVTRSGHDGADCDTTSGLGAGEGVERGPATAVVVAREVERPYCPEEESVRAVAEVFVGNLFSDCWSSTGGVRHSLSPSLK